MNNEVLNGKKTVVDEIADKINNAESIVLVEYQGLSVPELETLRNQLRAENVEMRVYKNTLARLAVDKLGYEAMKDDLLGPNAIAFSNEDAVAAARILAKFAKDHEALKIKTGIVEGNLVTTETLNELALLPSREGLLSMLLSCLQAPARDMALIVDALAKKVEEEQPAEAKEETKEEKVEEPKAGESKTEEATKAKEAEPKEQKEVAKDEVKEEKAEEAKPEKEEVKAEKPKEEVKEEPAKDSKDEVAETKAEATKAEPTENSKEETKE
jgi:large subunit ribosomal protein L10